MAPDTLVAQALGPTAHAQVGTPVAGADACTIVGSDAASIGLLHVSSTFPSGQAVDPLVLLTTMLQVLPSNANVDLDVGEPAATADIQATPVSGVGDSALLIVQSTGSDKIADLLVQRGADGFSFTTRDSSSSREQLVALAQAVVGNLPR